VDDPHIIPGIRVFEFDRDVVCALIASPLVTVRAPVGCAACGGDEEARGF